MKILRDGRDAWRKNAPKDAEIEAAQTAVEAARVALSGANPNELSGANPNEEADRERALQAAVTKLQELKQKREAADKALEAAQAKAKAKLDRITATDSSTEGSAPGGTQAPPVDQADSSHRSRRPRTRQERSHPVRPGLALWIEAGGHALLDPAGHDLDHDQQRPCRRCPRSPSRASRSGPAEARHHPRRFPRSGRGQ